jgi:hypothetical protein
MKNLIFKRKYIFIKNITDEMPAVCGAAFLEEIPEY